MNRLLKALDEVDEDFGEVKFPNNDCHRIKIEMIDGEFSYHITNALNEPIKGHWCLVGVKTENDTQWITFER